MTFYEEEPKEFPLGKLISKLVVVTILIIGFWVVGVGSGVPGAIWAVPIIGFGTVACLILLIRHAYNKVQQKQPVANQNPPTDEYHSR